MSWMIFWATYHPVSIFQDIVRRRWTRRVTSIAPELRWKRPGWAVLLDVRMGHYLRFYLFDASIFFPGTWICFESHGFPWFCFDEHPAIRTLLMWTAKDFKVLMHNHEKWPVKSLYGVNHPFDPKRKYITVNTRHNSTKLFWGICSAGSCYLGMRLRRYAPKLGWLTSQ